MSDHARLAPSSAHRWVKCGMSRLMAEQYPQQGDMGTGPAEEGTAAHWVAEMVLHGKPVCEGVTAPNGVIVTDEMIDGANLYADVIGTLDKNCHTESRVTMAQTIHPENWGTPDFWRFRDGVLSVVDYKFGFGYVDAF